MNHLESKLNLIIALIRINPKELEKRLIFVERKNNLQYAQDQDQQTCVSVFISFCASICHRHNLCRTLFELMKIAMIHT